MTEQISLNCKPILPEAPGVTGRIHDKRLDRIIQFDERSRSFPIRKLIAERTPRNNHHRLLQKVLNQGMDGACVGFGCAHEMIAYPAEVKGVDAAYARKIYKLAQKLDEWPGEAYSGTSVLAGLKAGQLLGAWDEYRWAFSFDELLLGLSWHGPAILGLNWYADMQETDDMGFIHLGGKIMGSHCILACGLDLDREAVKLANSWGETWGENGYAWISFMDLKCLLRNDGEAALAVHRHKKPGEINAQGS